MDIESTIETIGAYASDLGSAIEAVSGILPKGLNLKGALSAAADTLPKEVDFPSMMQFLLIFVGVALVFGVLNRAVLGKRSSLNHAVSSAMAVLFLYAATIVIYTCKPWELSKFLSPLPFITFLENHIMLLPFAGSEITLLCHEILSLVILSFLVILIDSIIPKGESVLSWCVCRLIAVVLSMGLHCVVTWAVNLYFPDALITYAPIILLGLLLGMLLLGVLNVILSLALAAVNPFFGAVYAFFFSNAVGKQLTKSVLTTALVCAVIYLLERGGYGVICITTAALLSYLPLVAVLLVLWFVIGKLL